ncbi:hypothetical protein LHYA1_G004440 [Lachnellula hyalina]|uniref:Fatty acid hydroxylase domain-containing protein n=1 Tax=Lachnellula hyalina TaxID=1316788 RepID=A0A8H8U1A9_9HELO|nr:uncharacterized protein LHYA1_G004440 [Lachnellula hyalina]TVY26846.1 hypothetical protein LHYA1_G004440 [Lachnellula hyalina]
MGAYLSIPAAMYFLSPSIGTYSTSLNLLFFYMTWSTMVLSFPPLQVEIVGTLAIRAIFFLLPSLLFLLFDSLLPSVIVNIKTQGEAALPTRSGGSRGSRKGGRPPWYFVIGVSLLNILLSVALQVGIELLFTQVLHIRSALQVTTTLPMPWSIAKYVIRSLFLREILQYYIHRFLLHPSSPTYISALHNTYFHSIPAPYSFAAHYDHPLPYLLIRFLPTYLPSLLFRTHLLTHLITLALTTTEETLTLSGYTNISGIMLGGMARRQDAHSESRGRGNYSPWGLMDWVHGTTVGPDVMDDVGEEAEKHHVKERGGKALADAKESGKDGIRTLSGRKKGAKRS